MKNLEDIIAPNLRGLKSYKVSDATGLVKLDAMENHYPLPEIVSQEISSTFPININDYPETNSKNLKAVINQVWSIPNGYDIVLGNGSDELIAMQIMALGGAGSVVMSLEPGFAVFKISAQALERRYVGIDLNEDFSINIDRTLKAIKEHNPSIFFIAYPNNPTGNLFNIEEIAAIIEAVEGIVVLDEAYTSFASDNWLNRITNYPNAVIQRTLSKSGLAGIRLGILIAPSAYCDVINRVRMPYNINVLTQEVGRIALSHYELFVAQTNKIIASRSVQFEALNKIEGISAFKSEANFILLKLNARLNAQEITQKIKENGVLVKCFDGAHPLLSNTIRVTIGTNEENQKFMEALQKSLQL